MLPHNLLCVAEQLGHIAHRDIRFFEKDAREGVPEAMRRGPFRPRPAEVPKAQELAALSAEREGLLQEVAALRAQANHLNRIEAALATLSQAKHAPAKGAPEGGSMS